MRNLKRLGYLSLYIILPAFGFIVIQFLFMYGQWEFNPSNWDSKLRQVACACGLLGVTIGAFAADTLNTKEK